eukprot:7587299-Prorocentrum_lima.AAC.1
MTSSLVGSEMCIRDRRWTVIEMRRAHRSEVIPVVPAIHRHEGVLVHLKGCLLYTSDAADDM